MGARARAPSGRQGTSATRRRPRAAAPRRPGPAKRLVPPVADRPRRARRRPRARTGGPRPSARAARLSRVARGIRTSAGSTAGKGRDRQRTSTALDRPRTICLRVGNNVSGDREAKRVRASRAGEIESGRVPMSRPNKITPPVSVSLSAKLPAMVAVRSARRRLVCDRDPINESERIFSRFFRSKKRCKKESA